MPTMYVDPFGLDAVLPRVLPIAGGAAAADGPVPVGDLIGLGLILGAIIYDACTDDDDFCYTRWEAEDTRCWQWKSLGMRHVKACQSRAATRRDLCLRNGGKPSPLEPPEYSPFKDYPR